MANETMQEEFPDEDQRLAVCNEQWSDKNSMTKSIEKRTVQFVIESRDDDAPKMIGHAAVFNEETNIAGMFIERVAPGAFKKSIKEDDVRALFNHDPNFVLGRNKAKTLILEEDERGLKIEISPPDTQVARDLTTLMKRGDISQMSFAFQVLRDEWEKGEDGKPDVRTLKKVRLFDVSPVTFPAYEGTDIAVRSHDEWVKSNKSFNVSKLRRRGFELRRKYE